MFSSLKKFNHPYLVVSDLPFVLHTCFFFSFFLSFNMVLPLSALNLTGWVHQNRHLLKPPVGNCLLYDGEFKVMIVGGPNRRTDYHVEAGEEWFYQLEGRMVLKIIDEAAQSFHDIVLGPGDTFCLPAGVPHSPQREPGSVGLVVERERRTGELDQLRWYCGDQDCRALVYQEEFPCEDLEEDLPPIMDRYYGDPSNRTCRRCGWVEPPLPMEAKQSE
mmetsp:Transcript_6233/g.12315  ORF Transcript_6233/g.12315 Transcript_6233/m.12315 type:complete len:218 (-) Transcript_6233:476-1129(-)